MSSRRKAREQAIQILFQMDACKLRAVEALKLFELSFNAGKPLTTLVHSLVMGVSERREELDRKLESHSENWRLDRMSLVDRNVLRMALYELLHMEEIPPKVSLNEAVDLGKKFGGEESGSFINGILDSIYRSLRMDSTWTKNPDEPMKRK